MKGFRFYAEYEHKYSKAEQPKNCVAISTETAPYFSSGTPVMEGFAAVFYHANSGVNWGGVALDYLRKKCRRISEAKARQIHPALFDRLGEPE